MKFLVSVLGLLLMFLKLNAQNVLPQTWVKKNVRFTAHITH